MTIILLLFAFGLLMCVCLALKLAFELFKLVGAGGRLAVRSLWDDKPGTVDWLP
jgi:hypothetical protein